MHRSSRSTDSTPASRSTRSAAARDRDCVRARRRCRSRARTAPRPRRPLRNSTDRLPGPIAAATFPPRAATPASTIPASSPIRPACSTATAGPRPFRRTSAIGRQSADSASIGTPARRSTDRRRRGRVRAGSARFTAPSAPAGSWRAAPHRRRSPRRAAAVLVDALGVVVRAQAEVERGERSALTPPLARRERDRVRPGASQRISSSS